QFGRRTFHPNPRIKSGAGSNHLPEGADRGRYPQIVIPAKAGIQGMGMSFDKLPSTGSGRTNAGETSAFSGCAYQTGHGFKTLETLSKVLSLPTYSAALAVPEP
ncbi:MAG: hypothetical protein J4G14_05060, partial [Dehalococcoidia bacterium]|nr:hypothetical protein [Dehalococcoidia bacterium]